MSKHVPALSLALQNAPPRPLSTALESKNLFQTMPWDPRIPEFPAHMFADPLLRHAWTSSKYHLPRKTDIPPGYTSLGPKGGQGIAVCRDVDTWTKVSTSLCVKKALQDIGWS